MPFDHQISNRLSDETVGYIRQVFETIMKVEQNIERMKVLLAKRPLFNIQEAFSLLNMEGYHKVTQEDLQHILKLHGIITF